MTTNYSPVLTSNTLPEPFVATASSNNSSAFLAFDGLLSTYWEPTTSVNGEYLEIDLVVEVASTQFIVELETSSLRPNSIKIQGANSNYPIFTDIQTYSSLIFDSSNKTILDITTPVAYRYFRLVIANSGGNIIRIANLQINRVSQYLRDIINSTNYTPIQPATIVKVPEYDTLLEPSEGYEFYNRNIHKLNISNIRQRPQTGQIFPRGYPVENAVIQYNPINKINVCRLGYNGFSVKEVTTPNGSSSVYSSSLDLTPVCATGSWRPTGSFCNILYPDDQDVMFKYGASTGAAFSTSANTYGILVVDLGTNTEFNAANVFQQFATGKVTHIEFFEHPELGNTAPLASNSNWTSISPEAFINAGTAGYNGFRDGDGAVISNPTKLTLPLTSTRYLKIQMRNTGIYGSSSWIELGGLKLFNL